MSVVFSILYPATCGSKGHGSGKGFTGFYTLPGPIVSLPQKRLGCQAVLLGLPYLLSPVPAEEGQNKREGTKEKVHFVWSGRLLHPRRRLKPHFDLHLVSLLVTETSEGAASGTRGHTENIRDRNKRTICPVASTPKRLAGGPCDGYRL